MSRYRQKRFKTLQAVAALAGIELNAISDDQGGPLYMATRWALTRTFNCLDQVEKFLFEMDAT